MTISTARLLLASAGVLLLSGAALAAGPDEWGLGPIDFRNEFALSQATLSLAEDSPATPLAGETRLLLRGDWAKTISDDRSIGAVLDTETLDVAPALQFGLTERIALGLELPFIERFPGALDPFIVDVERAATGNVRREHRDLRANTFQMSGGTDDGRTYRLHESSGIGKLRLSAKARLFDGDDDLPAVSLEAVLALPTGRPGLATSGVDAGARLSLSKRLGEDWIAYAGVSYVALGGNGLGGIALEWTKQAAFGAVEYQITDALSVVGDIWTESPTTANLDGAHGMIIYLGGGLKGTWDRFFWEVGALENGGDVTRSADITFHAEIGVSL